MAAPHCRLLSGDDVFNYDVIYDRNGIPRCSVCGYTEEQEDMVMCISVNCDRRTHKQCFNPHFKKIPKYGVICSPCCKYKYSTDDDDDDDDDDDLHVFCFVFFSFSLTFQLLMFFFLPSFIFFRCFVSSCSQS
jgi:hypothetical protein